MLAAMLAFSVGARLPNPVTNSTPLVDASWDHRDCLGWLRRSIVAQGQAWAISVLAPSIVASSIGAKLCGRSGGVEAMVTRP